MQIYPAILTDSLAAFARQLALVKQESTIKTIQVDVIDALFTDNVTITPSDLVDFDFGSLTIDFHLMTEEPMDYVWELIDCGQQLPTQSVTGQVEKMSRQAAFLEEVKRAGWQAGLALNLHTPVESIEDTAWEYLDHILLMAVEAGEQGQTFNQSIFSKIEQLHALMKKFNKEVKIMVDGGIKINHLSALQAAKVDQIALGSALFAAQNFNEEFSKFGKELV